MGLVIIGPMHCVKALLPSSVPEVNEDISRTDLGPIPEIILIKVFTDRVRPVESEGVGGELLRGVAIQQKTLNQFGLTYSRVTKEDDLNIGSKQ